MNKLLKGWDATNKLWIPVLVDTSGNLKVDISALLENPPTEDEASKAPTSEWAFDHDADIAAHHAKYTDTEAIAAAKTDSTLLNYTEGARVYHDSNQTLTTATLTILSFNQERYDTDTIHHLSTNNSRLTCKTAGKYIISATALFDGNATGFRQIGIILNGTTLIARCKQVSGHAATVGWTETAIYDLAINDYVEVQAYQNSGGDLLVVTASNFSPEFMMQRIG